jgi:glucan 1,3-beta-glucosidase
MVATPTGQTILPGGTTTISSWGRGSLYTDDSGQGVFRQDNLPPIQKSDVLLDGSGKFFERSRPQYDDAVVEDFISVTANGARGDGVTDDSDAIQAVINTARNSKIVYFPAGTYIISKTVFVPEGTRIIGETWSVLMADGAAFQNQNSPVPMLRVGNPGDSGVVEITDIMFGSKGAQPGVILVQWNIRESFKGSCGMWDTHFRVGGTAGSELQVADCPKGQGLNPNCVCGFMLLHVTASGSGYFENVWAWTADHDLDNHLAQGQITIWVGRGVLIESSEGPTWLYGTQSEHNVFYQYQLNQAKNVFMTMIQGETPYWQPAPKAPAPFTPNLVLADPSYAHCEPGSSTCALSWGLRAVRSSNVYLYGAGLYNFFNNYDQTCLNTEDCQDGMIELVGNTDFHMFNVNTKAAKNIVMADNTRVLATHYDNRNTFCSTINAFLAYA